jgi:hypothetical protein
MRERKRTDSSGGSSSKLKNTLFALLAAGLGVFLCLLALEVILRFLPVSEGLNTLPVNESNPVVRFKPNRVATWSKFPDFSLVNTVRVNNYGFVNNEDYVPNGPDPLVAVIGDSYVEATMVPFEDTGHGRLARVLQGGARVYSFASSGSALSQYLAYAAYCRDIFRPVKMIVVVVGNDFDESLYEYKSEPPFHYFAFDSEGRLELTRVDWSPSWKIRAARRSHLALYLLNNAEIRTFPDRLARLFQEEKATVGQGEKTAYLGNTEASWTMERLKKSRLAIEYFLEKLPEEAGLDAKDILFVVDGIRDLIYREDALEHNADAYLVIVRDYFIRMAEEKNFEVIDMHPVFERDWRLEGRPFEYENDGHWNSYGHFIFFSAVYDSGFVDEYKKGAD